MSSIVIEIDVDECNWIDIDACQLCVNVSVFEQENTVNIRNTDADMDMLYCHEVLTENEDDEDPLANITWDLEDICE